MSAALTASEPSVRYLATREAPLLAQFDLIAQSPGGIARLRELILSLAVQGKLVPQDPNDEPASVLLERIRAEKARLVREGKIRKEKTLAEIEQKGKPLALPKGWAESAFAELGWFSGGKTPSTHRPEYWGGLIPWVTSKDMKSLRISDTKDHVTERSLSEGLTLIKSGAVLVVVRSGILRRTVPVAITDTDCAINQDLKALQLFMPHMASYVQLMIRGFERLILNNLTKVGTTVESIRFEEFERYPFPIPPLAEQSRIVARVEELMALCDALEAKGKLQDEQHARLVGTLFDSLANSESAHALAENWQRVAAHFDLLLDRPAAVDALEQTILQLAVRGLLVPQDPADEPASVLLQKIRTEKNRLIAEGKIRRDKPPPAISEEQERFTLPEKWGWARTVDLCELITDGEHATPERTEDCGAVPLVTAKNVRDGFMDYRVTDYVPQSVAEKCWERCQPQKGDILMVSVGATLGRLSVLRESRDMVLVRSVTVFRPISNYINVDYLALHLNARDSQLEIWDSVKQSAQPCLYLEKSSALMIGLPPASEQSRIVARVGELRALCADLRQRLAAAEQTRSRLAETLVESALA